MGEQVAARTWGLSSVGRAPALQAGGREFESLSLHENNEESRRGETDRSRRRVLARRIRVMAGSCRIFEEYP